MLGKDKKPVPDKNNEIPENVTLYKKNTPPETIPEVKIETINNKTIIIPTEDFEPSKYYNSLTKLPTDSCAKRDKTKGSSFCIA